MSDTVANEADDETERKCLINYIKECEERFVAKAAARVSNDRLNNPNPSDDLHGLDCNVKKNCAFVKKLRNMTEGQKESLIKDMSSLNLSKYITEVAASIVEAKLKMSDLSVAMKICSLLNQRYEDFASIFLDTWNKNLPKKPSELANLNLSKMRIDIRFFAELITSGIFTLKEGLPILGNLLTLLVTSDKDNHNHLNIILTFCRHCGDDYAGLVPRSMRILSDKYNIPIPKSDFLATDRQKGLLSLLKDYYKSLAEHCIRDHKALQNLEKQNRQMLISKGELSDKRKEKYEQAQIAFQKLWSSTQQMADILDEDLPEVPPDSPDSLEDAEDKMMNLDVSNRFKTSLEYDAGSLWEDEDTRSFYEDIPDLKSLLPSILYRESAKEGKDKKDKEKTKEKDKNASGPAKDEPTKPEDQKSLAATPVTGLIDAAIEENEDDILKVDSDDETAPNLNEDDGTGTDDDSTRDPKVDKEETSTGGTKAAQPSAANKVVLEAFLTSLLNCVNRDMIDKAAMNFCTTLNTKYTRKKLVRTLFTVPRTRLDLLPFYARLVATLAPVMPNVANDLVQLLKQDFRFHVSLKLSFVPSCTHYHSSLSSSKRRIKLISKVKSRMFVLLGNLSNLKFSQNQKLSLALRLVFSHF